MTLASICKSTHVLFSCKQRKMCKIVETISWRDALQDHALLIARQNTGAFKYTFSSLHILHSSTTETVDFSHFHTETLGCVLLNANDSLFHVLPFCAGSSEI